MRILGVITAALLLACRAPVDSSTYVLTPSEIEQANNTWATPVDATVFGFTNRDIEDCVRIPEALNWRSPTVDVVFKSPAVPGGPVAIVHSAEGHVVSRKYVLVVRADPLNCSDFEEGLTERIRVSEDTALSRPARLLQAGLAVAKADSRFSMFWAKLITSPNDLLQAARSVADNKSFRATVWNEADPGHLSLLLPAQDSGLTLSSEAAAGLSAEFQPPSVTSRGATDTVRFSLFSFTPSEVRSNLTLVDYEIVFRGSRLTDAGRTERRSWLSFRDPAAWVDSFSASGLGAGR